MNPNRRAFSAAVPALVAAPGLRAQEWPARPIRIVVPYPAGGNADSASRVLAEAVSPALKQPLIVDNRPGASTISGTEMVARAAPDGYTLGLVTDSHAINQALARTPRGAELLGAELVDVPYKGLAPAATDLVGGQIDTMVMPIHYAQQCLSTGRLVGDPYPADAAELAARIRRDVAVYGAVIAANVK